ncbi:hypothetical protein BDN70DRAFT_883787 [Pholiota conissans]|uniref:Uncharacterized protein n=1 Tax=Pholiota conissans TaxID=109636 RepID=A0A9P5YVB2_9AGAR|nr:hypothetical protein BDN70DRAFT_883787 [Pholiota conissans]
MCSPGVMEALRRIARAMPITPPPPPLEPLLMKALQSDDVVKVNPALRQPIPAENEVPLTCTGNFVTSMKAIQIVIPARSVSWGTRFTNLHAVSFNVVPSKIEQRRGPYDRPSFQFIFQQFQYSYTSQASSSVRRSLSFPSSSFWEGCVRNNAAELARS